MSVERAFAEVANLSQDQLCSIMKDKTPLDSVFKEKAFPLEIIPALDSLNDVGYIHASIVKLLEFDKFKVVVGALDRKPDEVKLIALS